MVRPRAMQRMPSLSEGWRYLILDGYVDEPAALGVPPYISPHVRSLAGGLVTGGAEENEIGYLTVDGWRMLRGAGTDITRLPHLEAVVCISGCIVPGKYLRGDPISCREMGELALSFRDTPVIICGPAVSGLLIDGAQVVDGDVGVLGRGISAEGCLHSGNARVKEWNTHLVEGAFIVRKHPDFPSPLIAEIETAKGCVRYISGGCSFCSEPAKGPIAFREPEDVIEEIRMLSSMGLENIRIGGQSDLISYMSPDVGRKETPIPNPEAISGLMGGVMSALHGGPGVRNAVGNGRRVGIDTGIIHTDNANPSVIFAHPEESARVLSSLVKYTTSGSVLALGLESSDPAVKERNNLNTDPEEVTAAVRLINEIGGRRGENGLSDLLPGLNFLGGLPGQTKESFRYDIDLLKELYGSGLMIRRINIRSALFSDPRGGYHTKWENAKVKGAFRDFKKEVREKWDRRFLERLMPPKTILKGVLMEARSGRTSFGRQIGSYPILVGMPHDAQMGAFHDVVITELGPRSVTGLSTPIYPNRMSVRSLQGIPGVGKKRAAAIFRERPVDRNRALDIAPELSWLLDHIVFDR